jgi:carboxylesterase
MGEYLASRGLTVRCPLLPGHGTTPEALTRIRWRDWGDAVEAELADLQDRCQQVFVGGLSMGSVLTLWLGARHAEIAGLIPMAPAVKLQNKLAPLAGVLKYLFKYNPFGAPADDDLGDKEGIERIWCYDQLAMQAIAEFILLRKRVLASLPQIRQPILIFQGRRDAQLAPEAAQILHDGVASSDKTLIWLEHSGHNLLADGEREAVWSRSYDWITDRTTQRRKG